MRVSWLDDSDAEISEAELARVGVLHERLPLDDYQGALDRLKAERGYVAQDIVELRPDMPNLTAVCDKFKDEHLHRDDEVRFVLEGEGIFDIRGADGRWMRVQVEAGDLIVVPADPFLLAHTNLDPRLRPRPEARTARVDQFRAELWVAGGEAKGTALVTTGGAASNAAMRNS